MACFSNRFKLLPLKISVPKDLSERRLQVSSEKIPAHLFVKLASELIRKFGRDRLRVLRLSDAVFHSLAHGADFITLVLDDRIRLADIKTEDFDGATRSTNNEGAG